MQPVNPLGSTNRHRSPDKMLLEGSFALMARLQRCAAISQATLYGTSKLTTYSATKSGHSSDKEKTRKRLRQTDWTWIANAKRRWFWLNVGQRDGRDCQKFMDKLKRAITGRFQDAKSKRTSTLYRSRSWDPRPRDTAVSEQTEKRYSPATIARTEANVATPIRVRRRTSETLNAAATRLTNGFSKSIEHHTAMQDLFFGYNFCRGHETLVQESAKDGIARNRSKAGV